MAGLNADGGLLGIDPATYQRHPIHAPTRAYPETNCYADILVELLHARGDEPLAALGCTIRSDFEGDQFTFFKPPPEELEALFGIDIHEMQPYRPLPEQAAAQLRQGRTIIVELDSYYLPDTAATSYRTEHVKSSVIVEAIDVAEQRLRYFHNTGVYELDGSDFRGIFRLDGPVLPDVLPPYTELLRLDAGPRLAGAGLRAAAAEHLRGHLARRPRNNPFRRFGTDLGEQLPHLVAADAAAYHAYAFATVRMAGSAFEIAAAYTDWLFGRSTSEEVSAAFEHIVQGCKTLSLKLARRKLFDVEPAIGVLATAWDEAQERLDALAG